LEIASVGSHQRGVLDLYGDGVIEGVKEMMV